MLFWHKCRAERIWIRVSYLAVVGDNVTYVFCIPYCWLFMIFEWRTKDDYFKIYLYFIGGNLWICEYRQNIGKTKRDKRSGDIDEYWYRRVYYFTMADVRRRTKDG